MSEIEEFRARKDEFFRVSRHSPLTPDQREDFTGLRYYPENPALRFELPLERYSAPVEIKMQTSTGSTQKYYQVGQVHFRVSDRDVSLQVYEPVDRPGEYFVPFVDVTAPAETYGAGRYLEPESIDGQTLILDFNLAYNPYCAFDPQKWSCPLPPAENRLQVRIEAGEKNYHG